MRVCIETCQHYAPYPGIWFIVVNNGLPKDVVEQAVEGLEDVERFHNEKNEGVSCAIKQVLDHCNTEYFACVSDDVMFVPSGRNLWDEMLMVLENRSVGLVGPLSDGVLNCQRAAYVCDQPYLHASYLHGLFLLGRTEAWREVGGMDPELEGADEVDLGIRMMRAGYKMVINRRVYVHHDTSASLRTFTEAARKERHLKALAALLEKFSEEELYQPWTLPGYPSAPGYHPPERQSLEHPEHLFTALNL